MKARDWLVKQGLAKQGRGRFSREAKAALAKAIEEGMTFSDFKLTADETPKVTKVEHRATAPLVVREPVRANRVMWGIDRGTESSHSPLLIAVSTCGSCSRGVAYCNCNTGPKLPKWLGGSVGMLEKPTLV